MPNILENLNDRQKEAVLHTDGPLLIVAGAGAGKTKTVAHRIAHLVASGVDPKQILAVTFTNKAAKEMGDRISALLKPFFSLSNQVTKCPFVSTFHGLGAYILRENAEALGRSKRFSILDESESFSLMKQACKSCNFDPKEINLSLIQKIISSQKNKMVEVEEYRAKENGRMRDIVVPIWKKYSELLRETEAYDFDDLILETVLLLKNKKEILNFYQTLWRYIHIDEYQDTNTPQYELSRLLAEKHGNICVVGDSDQAIYSWRDADFRNILNFERNFAGAKLVLLEENYRSTKTILNGANRVIQKNKMRKEKNLFTQNETGEKISLYEALDENDEAGFVVRTVKELIAEKKARPDEIAVLYRANFQSRVIEEKFLQEKIPYQLIGTKFYDRKEIKDVIAFVKFALNPRDTESLKRIINVPPRGIGEVTLEKILAGREGEIPQKTREKINGFRQKMAKIQEILASAKLSDAIRGIVKETGIDMMFKDSPNKEDARDRMENLRELASIATKYDLLPPEEAVDKFLTDVALMSDQDSLTENKNGVRLMTVHASKGLEFKYVFVTGLEQNLFPHKRLYSDEETSDPEEERRLFYVAMTRAKKKLFFSYTASRMLFGSRQYNLPSEFLSDFDDTLMEVEETPLEQPFGKNNHNSGRRFGNGWTNDDDFISWDCLSR